MEEFVGEGHLQRRGLDDCSQDPFILVYGFRHLIAKQRRKALRKANNQRKKMLIHCASLSETHLGALQEKKQENLCGESLWDVFNIEESNKYKYQLSSSELLVQSHQILQEGQYSSQKSENATASGETSPLKPKIFAEQFLAFFYLE